MPATATKQFYDALGNGFEVGAVVQGFGFLNAGAFCTIKAISPKGILTLESHRTGKDFRDNRDYWRVVEA